MTPASAKCPQFQRASKDDNRNCCQNMARTCKKQIRRKYGKKIRRKKAEMARNLSKNMTRKCQNIWQAIMARNFVKKIWQNMPWKSRIYGMSEYAKTEIMTPIYGKYLCHNMARKCVCQENMTEYIYSRIV